MAQSTIPSTASIVSAVATVSLRYAEVGRIPGTGPYGNEDAWDAALLYGGSFGGVKIKAAITSNDQSTLNGKEFINGSVSVLLPFGLSVTIGAADRDHNRLQIGSAGQCPNDYSEWRYEKIGHKFNGLELGQTRLSVDYSQNDCTRFVNDEAGYWGLGVVQIVEPLDAELYAVYHSFEYDRGVAGAINLDDVDRFTVGVRFKF